MDLRADSLENLSKTELLELFKAEQFSKQTLEKANQELEVSAQKYQSENDYLKFILVKLQRMLFGTKSERFIPENNPEQLQLPFDVDDAKVEQAVEVVVEQIAYERKKKKSTHAGRMALPSHLPVNEIFVEPTENVEGLTIIGQEITDELEYEPGKLHINRYIRNKYISKENEKGDQEVIIASLDFRPIAKCIAGVYLLAQIIADKFLDHLPLHRQIMRYARECNVNIPSSTMDSWVKLTSNLLFPLYECLHQHTVLNGYLQVDESTIKVMDSTKKGQTHCGYMWVYHAPMQKSTYFDYRKGRSAEGPTEMLKGYKGYLQTDGYDVYDKFGADPDIIPVACWAHARRRFEEALKYNKTVASHILKLIQYLYRIERFTEVVWLTIEEKKAFRLEHALPILNQLGVFIADKQKTETPRSPLGTAYQYCMNRWDSLLNYLHDGNIHIDNNSIENKIRPLALGRKNFLFAGSHDAAINIAMYYSFFATCKQNDIAPKKWLVYVLKNINETKISELKNLLPQFIDPILLD